MPLDLNRMLMQLSPVQPVDFGSGQKSYAREQLELARQQFEETKRQHEEQNATARLAAANALTVAQLGAQKAREKTAAEAAAKLQEQRLAGVQKVSDLATAGNAEGALAMSPVLDMLGSGLELQGQSDGLPRMRVIPNRAADDQAEAARLAQASPVDPEGEAGTRPSDEVYGATGSRETAAQSLDRLAALGYPTNDTGTMDAPEAISASGQLDSSGKSVADRVAATYGTPGEKTATAAPDEEDDVGGVPRDVIDMGALHQLTLRRLNPALKAAGEAYGDKPSEESAKKTAEMAAASGLPMDKALELFDKGRQAPDALRRTQLLTEAQQDKFRETRDDLTPMQVEQLTTMGTKDAKDAFKSNDVTGAVNAMQAADTVTALMKGDKRNQEKAVNYLMMMTHNKGQQTEADALRVIGAGQLNSIEQLEEWLHKKVKGGFSPEEINAIQEFVDGERDRNKGIAFDYLDRMNEATNDPTSHERRRTGVRQFVDRNVPNWVRDEYDATKKAESEEDDKAGISRDRQPTAGKDGTPNYAAMNDVDLELEGQAMEAGLDPDAIRPLVRTESGGDPTVKNHMGSSASGLFQFTDETAQKYGLKNAAEYAALPPEKQIELGIKRFKDIGLDEHSTRDDYAIANAAPGYVGKSDDKVIDQYKAGTPFGDDVRRKNPGWIPADGADITVGSIKRFYRGGGKEGAGKPGQFDTPLSAEDEKSFQAWKQKYAPKDSGGDYDLRGAFKAGLKPDPKSGHWPDTFKKPNHPTFSVESKYASAAPDKAGHWDGDTYVPARAVLAPKTELDQAVKEALGL